MTKQILLAAVLCCMSVQASADTDSASKAASTQYQICLVQQHVFDELLKAKQETCVANLSNYRQCAQGVADKKSGNTGKGALIGIGAAILTGGATLIFAGAGALVGHESTDDTEQVCGKQPDCDQVLLVADVEKITGPRPPECVKPPQNDQKSK